MLADQVYTARRCASHSWFTRYGIMCCYIV
jgi:hypothetical protein